MDRSSLLRSLRGQWLVVLGLVPTGAVGCDTYEFVPCTSTDPDEAGFGSCGEYSHRIEVVICDAPAEGNPFPDGGFGGGAHGCTRDSDCADLPSRHYCLCTDEGGWCTAAGCLTDADCTAPYLCATIEGVDPFLGDEPPFRLACQSPEDECMVSSDCPGDDWCSANQDGARRCLSSDCGSDCGRPFLVEEAPRRAATALRSDWCGDRPPVGVQATTASERSALCDHWTRVATMEHASVAAFARSALQLLALGAPADLVAATSAAMADEIRHAQLAFALASAYGGSSLGPAPLPIDGALQNTDLPTVARLALLEGGLGETAAAVFLVESAQACDEPLREALLAIAEDEQRHAELGWRTVAWALRVGGADVRRALEEERARISASASGVLAECSDPLARFGVLSSARFTACRTDVIRSLVLPLLDAALGAHADGGRRAKAISPRNENPIALARP